MSNSNGLVGVYPRLNWARRRKAVCSCERMNVAMGPRYPNNVLDMAWKIARRSRWQRR